MKNDTVPEEIDLQLLIHIAITADRYALEEALKAWVKLWMRHIPVSKMSEPGFENALIICGVFILPQMEELARKLAWRAYEDQNGELFFKNGRNEITFYGCLRKEPLGKCRHIPACNTQNLMQKTVGLVYKYRNTILKHLYRTLSECRRKYDNSLYIATCNVRDEGKDYNNINENCDILQLGDMTMQIKKGGLDSDQFWMGSPQRIVMALGRLRKRSYPAREYSMAPKHDECYWFKALKRVATEIEHEYMPVQNWVSFA